MILKELDNGDIFRHFNGKNKKKYLVFGNPMFNIRYGSATRICVDLLTRESVSKSCRLEVQKIGESAHKPEIMARFKGKQQPKYL